jgi:hypothetical protein
MLKRTLAMILVVGLGTWIVSSCGSKVTPVGASGTVYSFVRDVPFCGVANFRADITGIALVGPGGTLSFPMFPSGARSPLYKVNFGGLRDFSTLLDISKVPVGTWVQARVTFSIGLIADVDFTQNPPIQVMNASFTNTTTTVNISPPLVVTANTVSALDIDLDMARSLVVDPQGNITGGVNPALTVSSLTASGTEGFGEMDDMTGFVTSVTTTGVTGGAFDGGFSFQSLSGSAPLVTANFVSGSVVCGLTAAPDPACAQVVAPPGTPQYIHLDQLLTGSFVELDGYVDSNGNLVANTVELEDREVVESNKLALIGTVVSVTRNQGGSVTQFELYVRELEPDQETQASLDSIVTVNLDSATVYECTTCRLQQAPYYSVNFADLPFDSTALAPGQEVVVHGVATRPNTPGLPTTIASNPAANLLLKVYLKLQSHQGNFTSLVNAQSDDRTGAFWLSSCSSLFHGAPILVATNSRTSFVNAAGLTALTPQSPLLVKGLLFYELNGTTVNGITVPPGTLVLEAKQVHAL